MRIMNLLHKISLFLIVLMIGCTDKFNDIPTSSGTGNIGNVGDTVYVKQNPDWDRNLFNFSKPQDIIVGREPFIYIANTGNNEIIMMDISGQVLGTKSIFKPVAIAQDYQLNLIVCGSIIHNNDTLGAVYKINLVAGQHQLNSAPVDTLLPKTSFDFLKPDREYTGACVFYNNSFYITRRGPSNSSLIDPDNAILIFRQKLRQDGSKTDTLVGTVPGIQKTGTGIPSLNRLSSITSFNNNSLDIITSLIGENSFKVQWLKYVSRPDFEGYEIALSPLSSDMMQINKFARPEDVTIDNRKNIFIADAEKDSVFKFNSFGDELESFGGPDIFDSPHAVAVFDKTVYVVDTNNDRILRFILSTEID